MRRCRILHRESHYRQGKVHETDRVHDLLKVGRTIQTNRSLAAYI